MTHSPAKKAIIVGFDGASMELVSHMVEQGHMPNVGKLMAQGVHREMLGVFPTLTPPGWTTLTTGAWRQFFRSLRTLALGLGVALGVAFLATEVLKISGLRTETLVIDENLLTFVTVVSVSTVIVAVVAGVAAMTAFVTSQATTAVGVAISVTTIPAAAYAGIAIASTTLAEGGAALLVLAVNVVCLIVAQILTLVVIKAWRARRLQV